MFENPHNDKQQEEINAHIQQFSNNGENVMNFFSAGSIRSFVALVLQPNYKDVLGTDANAEAKRQNLLNQFCQIVIEQNWQPGKTVPADYAFHDQQQLQASVQKFLNSSERGYRTIEYFNPKTNQNVTTKYNHREIFYLVLAAVFDDTAYPEIKSEVTDDKTQTADARPQETQTTKEEQVKQTQQNRIFRVQSLFNALFGEMGLLRYDRCQRGVEATLVGILNHIYQGADFIEDILSTVELQIRDSLNISPSSDGHSMIISLQQKQISETTATMTIDPSSELGQTITSMIKQLGAQTTRLADDKPLIVTLKDYAAFVEYSLTYKQLPQFILDLRNYQIQRLAVWCVSHGIDPKNDQTTNFFRDNIELPILAIINNATRAVPLFAAWDEITTYNTKTDVAKAKPTILLCCWPEVYQVVADAVNFDNANLVCADNKIDHILSLAELIKFDLEMKFISQQNPASLPIMILVQQLTNHFTSVVSLTDFLNLSSDDLVTLRQLAQTIHQKVVKLYFATPQEGICKLIELRHLLLRIDPSSSADTSSQYTEMRQQVAFFENLAMQMPKFAYHEYNALIDELYQFKNPNLLTFALTTEERNSCRLSRFIIDSLLQAQQITELRFLLTEPNHRNRDYDINPLFTILRISRPGLKQPQLLIAAAERIEIIEEMLVPSWCEYSVLNWALKQCQQPEVIQLILDLADKHGIIKQLLLNTKPNHHISLMVALLAKQSSEITNMIVDFMRKAVAEDKITINTLRNTLIEQHASIQDMLLVEALCIRCIVHQLDSNDIELDSNDIELIVQFCTTTQDLIVLFENKNKRRPSPSLTLFIFNTLLEYCKLNSEALSQTYFIQTTIRQLLIPDRRNVNILSIALKHNQPLEIIESTLNIADQHHMLEDLLCCADEYENTALLLALKTGQSPAVVNLIINAVRKVEAAVQNKGEFYRKILNCWSTKTNALALAVMYSEPEVVQEIIKLFRDFGQLECYLIDRNCAHDNVLLTLIQKQQLDQVRLLVELALEFIDTKPRCVYNFLFSNGFNNVENIHIILNALEQWKLIRPILAANNSCTVLEVMLIYTSHSELSHDDIKSIFVLLFDIARRNQLLYPLLFHKNEERQNSLMIAIWYGQPLGVIRLILDTMRDLAREEARGKDLTEEDEITMHANNLLSQVIMEEHDQYGNNALTIAKLHAFPEYPVCPTANLGTYILLLDTLHQQQPLYQLLFQKDQANRYYLMNALWWNQPLEVLNLIIHVMRTCATTQAAQLDMAKDEITAYIHNLLQQVITERDADGYNSLKLAVLEASPEAVQAVIDLARELNILDDVLKPYATGFLDFLRTIILCHRNSENEYEIQHRDEQITSLILIINNIRVAAQQKPELLVQMLTNGNNILLELIQLDPPNQIANLIIKAAREANLLEQLLFTGAPNGYNFLIYLLRNDEPTRAGQKQKIELSELQRTQGIQLVINAARSIQRLEPMLLTPDDQDNPSLLIAMKNKIGVKEIIAAAQAEKLVGKILSVTDKKHRNFLMQVIIKLEPNGAYTYMRKKDKNNSATDPGFTDKDFFDNDALGIPLEKRIFDLEEQITQWLANISFVIERAREANILREILIYNVQQEGIRHNWNAFNSDLEDDSPLSAALGRWSQLGQLILDAAKSIDIFDDLFSDRVHLSILQELLTKGRKRALTKAKVLLNAVEESDAIKNILLFSDSDLDTWHHRPLLAYLLTSDDAEEATMLFVKAAQKSGILKEILLQCDARNDDVNCLLSIIAYEATQRHHYANAVDLILELATKLEEKGIKVMREMLLQYCSENISALSWALYVAKNNIETLIDSTDAESAHGFREDSKALMKAAESCGITMTDFLTASDKFGNNAIMAAINIRSLLHVKTLLCVATDPTNNVNPTTLKQLLLQRNKNGDDCLLLALTRRNEDVIKLIINTAKSKEIFMDMVLFNQPNNSFLLQAVSRLHFRDILDYYSVCITSKENEEKQIQEEKDKLHHSISLILQEAHNNGLLKPILLYMDADDDNLLAQMVKGKQEPEKLQILLEAAQQADVLRWMLPHWNRTGNNCLMIAIQMGDLQCTEMILKTAHQLEADPFASMLQQCNEDGYSPILLALAPTTGPLPQRIELALLIVQSCANNPQLLENILTYKNEQTDQSSRSLLIEIMYHLDENVIKLLKAITHIWPEFVLTEADNDDDYNSDTMRHN